MSQVILLDVAPDPAGTRALLVVILLVIGFIVLLAFGLVVFLWYRKRGLRHVEMIRRDTLSAELTQPSNPNQP
jgi:flagellar basal body-associated protein FliL